MVEGQKLYLGQLKQITNSNGSTGDILRLAKHNNYISDAIKINFDNRTSMVKTLI